MNGSRKLKPGSPKIAIALIRVSTNKQELGPEAQRAAIEAWAKREGVHVAQWFSEVVSGMWEVAARKGLLSAIAAIRDAEAGVLVVAKRDRLGRSVVQNGIIESLCKTEGAVVVCADGTAVDDGTPEATFVRTLFDAMAQMERARIAQRTIAALAVKKARGERVGQIPYGWRLPDDGGQKLVEVDAEQKIIREARKLYRTGMSIRTVAYEIAKRGYKSRSGRRLRSTQVERMLGTLAEDVESVPG